MTLPEFERTKSLALTILDQIDEHRNNAANLLKQATLLHVAAKGFNSIDQKTDARTICNELIDEATAENEKADELADQLKDE